MVSSKARSISRFSGTPSPGAFSQMKSRRPSASTRVGRGELSDSSPKGETPIPGTSIRGSSTSVGKELGKSRLVSSTNDDTDDLRDGEDSITLPGEREHRASHVGDEEADSGGERLAPRCIGISLVSMVANNVPGCDATRTPEGDVAIGVGVGLAHPTI